MPRDTMNTVLRNLSRALGRVLPDCITLSQAIAFNMFVAFFMVGIHHGLGSFDYTLAFASIAVMLLFYGPGILALDRKIGFA